MHRDPFLQRAIDQVQKTLRGDLQAPVVRGFFHEPTFTASYVVHDPVTKRAAIVDSVLDFDQASGRTSTPFADEMIAYVCDNGLTVDWLLETHAHADHLSAAPYLQDKLGGKLVIGRHIRTVQDVAKNGKLNRVDAEVFLCALYRRENQSKLAVPLVQDLIRRYPRNYLLRMELGQMYSQSGDGVRGLQALEDVARLKHLHAPGFDRVPWEKIYYQQGSIQFWYNDLDRSLDNMKKVAAAGEEVDLNTGVQAYLRMGQIYDIKQRRAEAVEAYKKAIAYAPQAEAAQESRKYLSTPYRRM